MEKVVNKTYIGNKEVTAIAEYYPVKIYQADDIIYFAIYDKVMAEVNPNSEGIISIDSTYMIKHEAN